MTKTYKLLLTALLMLFSAGAWAQNRSVSGTVTDAGDNTPLPGVSISVKGTTTGTTTDANGKYTVDVPDNATLVFSFIGFTTQEAAVGSQNVLNVSLVSDTKALEEVVVTAIGLETPKKTLGYAIQTVKPDEIVSSRETNLVSALSGKVAGVQIISSSGSPGASALIRIRGSRSITGTNSPLFVIDGVPIDNSEEGNAVDGVDQSNRAVDINPNDVASLTVLKGPAATALYGLRAANGAVIITTKRGKYNTKPTVTFSSSYGIDQVNKLPELQKTYAQGRPRGDAPTYRGPETGEGFSWGPKISDLEFDGAKDYPFSTLR